MPITLKEINNLNPKDKPYRVFDGGGLYLEVMPSGQKFWRLKYRFADKESRLSLGAYSPSSASPGSLTDARKKRDEARRLLAEGIDPASLMTKKAKTREARLRLKGNFEAMAREWWEHKKREWTPDHATRILKSLDDDVFPVLGSRPLRDIQTPEILAMLRTIQKRGVFDTATRIKQRVNAVFRYAIQTGRASYNPAAELAGVLATKKVTHRPAVSEDELPAFLRALADYRGAPAVRLGLKLLLLTWVRPGELRFARWSEFDLEGRMWRIPAERMKMKAPHVVPLSDQALAVLDELRPFTGRYELLFPGAHDRTRPVSENTLNHAIRKRMGFAATAHGFRATASTILNERGFHPDAIERQLSHIERNKIRAAYHRSEYLPERVRMMQAWADYLDSLTAPNVIPFPIRVPA